FAQFPSGVMAVAALIDGEPVGMAASSFIPVSLDPPLVSLCFAKSSSTWAQLRGATGIGVSILGEHEAEVSGSLSRPADRFDQVVDAGDHVLVLLEVEDLASNPGVPALVFHRSRYAAVASS